MSNHLKAATSISAVTLASRILGLVRDVMMFRMLGFSWATGTFAFAWMLPNLLRRLFGEGALSAAFVPSYVRAAKDGGPAEAKRLLGSVTGMLLLVLGLVTACVLVLCFLLPAEAVGRGNADVSAHRQGEVLLELLIILFPYAIPICLAAVFAGALNAHGIFALPASAPILLNLAWITGLIVAWSKGLSDAAEVVLLLAVFLVAAGVAQMLISLVPLILRGHMKRPHLPANNDPAMDVLRNMGPTVVGMSLVQINTMLDQGLANYLIGPEAPGYIYIANRLLLFPHALTSLALATAIFPRMSRLAAGEDLAGLRKSLDAATHHTLLVALPAAVGMMLVAEPLVELMFGQSVATSSQLSTATMTTVCLVAALPMIGIAQLHARAFYALGDFRTPAWMSFWLLLLNLGLNLLFVLVLGMGVPGFALATTLASVVNALALRRKFTARTGGHATTRLRLVPAIVACAVMAAVVYATLHIFSAETRLQAAIFDLALPIACGILTYAGSLYLLGQRRLRMR